ncbi:hypothetical protein O974_10055 [Mycobacterium avium 11-0986]|nr:hypothetical protein O974_10055 [Mycobacterium avium 11-0986]
MAAAARRVHSPDEQASVLRVDATRDTEETVEQALGLLRARYRSS